MVSETLELIIRTTGASAASSQMASISSSAKSAAASVNLVAESFRLMRNVLVAFSFIRVFEGVAQAVNSFQSMNNQLRIVTTSLAEANDLQKQLANTAIRTRSNYADTVSLFSAIARATTSMGLNFNQINDITEKINMSLVESGSSANQARNSIRDLIELLNQGIVGGRIFRSLLMQDPVLLNAVAQTIHATGKGAEALNKQLDKIRASGKNISGGGLREEAIKLIGAMTSDDLVRAIMASKMIGDSWKLTAVTVGQAFENLKTQSSLFINTVVFGTAKITSFANAIAYVGDNLKGLSEILLIVGGAIALAAFGGWAVALAGGVGPALAIAAAFGLAAVNSEQLVSHMKPGFWSMLPSIISGMLTTLVDQWPLIMKVMGEGFSDLLASMANMFSGWINWISTQANKFGGTHISMLPTNRPEHTALSDRMKLNTMLQYNVNHAYAQSHNLAPFDDPNKTRDSGTTVNVPTAEAIGKDTMARQREALQSLENELSKFAGPSLKFQDNIDKMSLKITDMMKNTVNSKGAITAYGATFQEVDREFRRMGFDDLTKSVDKNGKAFYSSAELMRAETRETLGLKNGSKELTDRILEVSDALARKNINQAEANRLISESVKQNRLLELSTQNTIAAGIETGRLKQSKTETNDIAESVFNGASGREKAGSVDTYNTQISTLNSLLADGTIHGEAYKAMLFEIRDAFLKTKTDAMSGFNQGLLEIQKSLDNTAGDISKTMVNAFDSLESALTHFADTGKFTVKDMMNSIRHDLDSLIVKQGIMKPLMDLLMGDPSKPGSNVVGAGSTGIMGTLGKALGGTGQLGATEFNAMWVKMVGGPGDPLSPVNVTPDVFGRGGAGSASSGILSLFGMGSTGGGAQVQSTGSLIPSPLNLNSLLLNDLPGFATGGSFSVGGSGATDSQMVAFKATPGEHVQVGGGGPHVVINDNRTSQSAAPVGVRSSIGSDGRTQLEVTVADIVDKNLASGKHDTTMSTSFGVNRTGSYGAFNPASSPGSL